MRVEHEGYAGAAKPLYSGSSPDTRPKQPKGYGMVLFRKYHDRTVTAAQIEAWFEA